MKHIFTLSAFAAAALFLAPEAQAQTQPAKRFGRTVEAAKCGTTEYETLLNRKNRQRQSAAQFEQWIAPKATQAKLQRLQRAGLNNSAMSTNATVTIPVVVHIIHNGDAIGENENIADTQVLSQIQVLNQDFRRVAGTPGFNNHPDGADAEIEFCLAQRDPAGLNTSGIIRHELGSEDSWDMEEVEIMKTETQWDPTKYLNIWVVNQMTVGGAFELYGYAQFPEASGLDGLDEEGISFEANTDGVVIAAYCFGSEDIYPEGFYLPGNNKGRTSSHEIGHFFGLRHIWGDETDCTGNDYCADTPVAADANSGCPGANWDSCPTSPGKDMIQNYMDYTDDSCKNIFTADQKDRMVAVLANSPRRLSLITSNACTPGQVFDNDGSLNIQGINPGCGTTFTPSVVLKNTGNNTLTTATISYKVDAQPAAIYSWTGTLANGQQTTIPLQLFDVGPGSHTFNVALTAVNGGADQAPSNDNKSQSFTIVGAYNTTEVTVSIKTDDWGSETIWILGLQGDEENAIAGNIDFNTGNIEFYDDNELRTFTIPVQNNTCYTFGVFDLGGDGMCCEFGEGYYRVETAAGIVIAEGGQFGQQISKDFRIDTSLGMGEAAGALNNMSLYPNPANSMVTIALPQHAALPEGYTVYNSLGQVMGNGKFASSVQQVNISGYANGVYFIKVALGESTKTMQFIKY